MMGKRALGKELDISSGLGKDFGLKFSVRVLPTTILSSVRPFRSFVVNIIIKFVFFTQFRIPCFIRYSADVIPLHHSVFYRLVSFRILTRPRAHGIHACVHI